MVGGWAGLPAYPVGGGYDALQANGSVSEAVVREILPSLKELGAEGIIEYPLNKLIH